MSGINDLPADDLWPIIFKNLSIKDLFTCRLVNKKFKEFSDNTNGIQKLIIGKSNYEFDDFYWFYNNTLIKDQDIISLQCFRLIKLLSIFNLDKYLKYLKIYDQKFKLDEELSNLINLEAIEFGFNYHNDNLQILHSNNLKVIVCIDSNLLIKLNKPKLEKIQFNHMNKIKLNGNPESIKHLITTNYVNELKIFKNLEIIELRDSRQFLNANLLIIFKNLKKFKFKLNFHEINYSNEQLKNSLIKILNDKMKLRRELDIYLEGVKIENIDKFNELANRNSIWEFRMNNYDLLDLNLPFIFFLSYYDINQLSNNIKTDLPLSFFDKFFNINYVSINESVKDFVSLNWFLNNLKYLTKLYINEIPSLDDALFSNLPITIRCLEIENGSKINYNFILKLPNLIYFTTFCDNDLFYLVFTSFLNLKYLEKFGFYYKNKYISIRKKDNSFILDYIEEKLDYKEREKLDYNQLVEKCNLIRFK